MISLLEASRTLSATACEFNISCDFNWSILASLIELVIAMSECTDSNYGSQYQLPGTFVGS